VVVDLGGGGGTRELLTDDAGVYRFQGNQRRFAISVDEETLPFADPIPTTLRGTYTLNVPAGFIAPNVDFGYRAAGPEDQPPLQAATTGSGGVSPDGTPDAPSDDTVADDDEESNSAAETAVPEATRKPLLTPKEGRWRARNGPLRLSCGGLNLDQPGLPPEDGKLMLRQGGDRLVMRGFAEGSNQAVRVDRQPDRPERYVGGWPPIRVQGGRVELRFVVDVISPERMAGVLRGSARVQGVQCEATREVDLRYVGS
jgi:hypothetical protein